MEKTLFRFLVINYLKLLTSYKLRKFNGKIIGVAGCFGKSSAITLLEQAFKQEYSVYTTNQDGKGLNSETGIPFVVLGVHPDKYNIISWIKYCFQATKGIFKKFDYDFFIVELGVDKPDDLKFLTSFIQPDLGILINSNNTHSANFEELQEKTKKTFEALIAYENGYIFEKAQEGIIYNLDDPEVVKQISRFKGNKKLPFSTLNNSQVIEFTPQVSGIKIRFVYKEKEHHVSYSLPLLEEYKNTFEMLIKAGEFYDLKPESITKAIEQYELPPGRCSLFKGIKGSYILDSSYNSSYLPASSAIKLLHTLSLNQQSSEKTNTNNRTIAVLGDMRELGMLSEKEHRKLAEDAVNNIDIIITVGPLMKKFFNPEFINAKKESQQIYSFETTKEALELLSKDNFEFIQENDLILVKGSQNTLMLEIIVEKLLASKDDINKLCRRGKFYEEARNKLR